MDAKGLGKGPLIAAAAVLALLGFGPQVKAQIGPEGYVFDRGGNPVTDRGGECVNTRGWQPSDAIVQCDPDLVTPLADVARLEEEMVDAETRRVTIQAETLFDFDEYELSDRGQQVLDQLVETIQRVDEPRVHIAGYTDFIGPEEYNEWLSQQRADAVKEHLVSQGVPEQVIVTEARGESDPVVSCEGLSGDELVACLRPNRRTEIEFAGFEEVEVPVDQQRDMTGPGLDGELNGSGL